ALYAVSHYSRPDADAGAGPSVSDWDCERRGRGANADGPCRSGRGRTPPRAISVTEAVARNGEDGPAAGRGGGQLTRAQPKCHPRAAWGRVAQCIPHFFAKGTVFYEAPDSVSVPQPRWQDSAQARAPDVPTVAQQIGRPDHALRRPDQPAARGR